MADDRSDAARPSWRRKTNEPAKPPARSAHEWSTRRLKPVAAKQPINFGLMKRLGALAGLLVCLAGIVWLILMPSPPSSVAVVLVGADYADNLAVPQNVLGWKGLKALEALVKTPRSFSLLPGARLHLIGDKAQPLDQRDNWGRLVDELVTKGIPQKTVIIVLALHGGSDPQGAYLYPGRMSSPGDRIPLKSIIEDLGKLPPDKEKLLVIEAAQVPSDWRLGMLHNNFAQRLEDLEADITKVPNLRVLSAADVDQRCWASEGLGRTIFTHFLIEALSGKATQRGDRLNLKSLYEFVSKNVSDWVWNQRGALQKPVLLPRDEEAVAALRPLSQIEVPVVDGFSGPTFEKPDIKELQSAWDALRTLDRQVPHPSVYSPRRWRQYRAELVRFEELVRAGAAEQAQILAQRLRTTQGKLDNERVLRVALSSIENNLAMGALVGASLPSAADGEFKSFWETDTVSKADSAWKSLEDAANGAEESRALRLRADEFLIGQAMRDPETKLGQAAQRLGITRRRDAPRPAETHFLRMLNLWLGPRVKLAPKRRAAIKGALDLKMQSERTALGDSAAPNGYAYSEQIFPWIRDSLTRADGLRRSAEDRLFADDEAAWNQAIADQDKVRKSYAEIASRSVTIRKALSTRDRALAILPELSHWAADRGADELQQDPINDLKKLWEKTHLLSSRLESDSGKATASSTLGEINRLAGEVSKELDSITDVFSRQVKKLSETFEPGDWERAPALAAASDGMPGVDADHEKIWQRILNLHDRDTNSIKPGQSGTDAPSNEDVSENRKQVRARAEAQGRMALAALGQTWFDDPHSHVAAEQGDFETTLGQVHVAGELKPERTWRQDVAQAGDRVGVRWRKLTEEIDSPRDEPHEITDVQKFRNDNLTKADRLERVVDGGTLSRDSEGIPASVLLRETWVHDLLLGMADRAWEDHWYDENNKDRYFHEIGSRYIEDAKKLFPKSKPAGDAGVRMNRKGRLTIKVDSRRTLTSETQVEHRYQLADEGDVPTGLPVIRPEVTMNRAVKSPLAFSSPAADGFHNVSREGPAKQLDVVLSNPLGNQFENDAKKNRPDVETARVKMEGYFRGQKFDGTTEMSIHPVPDTVAIGPPPTAGAPARIAVRASGEIINTYGASNGSIAIVLDCSGSMLDATPTGRTKFQEAQLALRQVLEFVPQGANLSLWTFSQIPQGVAQVFKDDPLVNEPELSIAPLRQMARWDKNQTQALAAQVAALRPWLATPLVTAMWKAANQDLKAAPGLKTLLVLTDGDDSELVKNKHKYNPQGLPVKDFIVNGFRPLGIRVNMVFFTPAGKPDEIKRAEENFRPALRQLDPPGSFTTAKDLDQLIRNLKSGLVQKLACQILKPDMTTVGELEVTDPQAKEEWSRALAPGSYKLKLNAGSTRYQDIDLREGDRLIVELVEEQPGVIGFRRGLYSDSHEFASRSKEGQPWRMTVLTNRDEEDGGQHRLVMVAALERQAEAKPEGAIRQVSPGFAWFEIGPEGSFMARWRRRVFFPGPVWHFDVPQRIKNPAGVGIANPTLKAWWSEQDSLPEPAIEIPWSPDRLGGNSSYPVLGKERGVQIEFIGLENHHVEVEPGTVEDKQCLVIRLGFDASHRYFVDPRSLRGLKKEVVGHEHRFYSKAKKYTGVFWPVNPEEYKPLSSLALIDLNRFCKDAEKLGNFRQQFLDQPRVDSPIPAPIEPR